MDLVAPIVHRNGTGKEELLRQREEACHSLWHALEELSRMAPNARDYYPEPGLFERARALHVARAKALRDVYDGIMAEREAILEAGA